MTVCVFEEVRNTPKSVTQSVEHDRTSIHQASGDGLLMIALWRNKLH